MSDLGSAPLPEVSEGDHLRGPLDADRRGGGAAIVLIEYADFECPYCAVLHSRLAGLPSVVRVFRHFPVRSSHPRAWAAACAAEAAGLQGRFWEMHDVLFADQAHLEDPHLWTRAGDLGLDIERFDADRRTDGVAERVKRDFASGVRAGVVTTPTVFHEGAAYYGDALRSLLERLGRPEGANLDA